MVKCGSFVRDYCEKLAVANKCVRLRPLLCHHPNDIQSNLNRSIQPQSTNYPLVNCRSIRIRCQRQTICWTLWQVLLQLSRSFSSQDNVSVWVCVYWEMRMHERWPLVRVATSHGEEVSNVVGVAWILLDFMIPKLTRIGENVEKNISDFNQPFSKH